MRRNAIQAAAISLGTTALLATAGCGQFKESLGLTKNPPDEFQVVSREPLSMPPKFDLRPPEPSAERPQGNSTRDRARQTVFRATERQSRNGYKGGDSMSAGEEALLTQAGANNTPEDIRQVVKQETERLGTANRSFVNRLVFWQDPQDPATVIDAEREAKRLRENAALGKEVTEGRTPIIERRERGFLEGFFGGLL